jgi:hypothetical protein
MSDPDVKKIEERFRKVFCPGGQLVANKPTIDLSLHDHMTNIAVSFLEHKGMEIPASTSPTKHGCFPGGLASHILCVAGITVELLGGFVKLQDPSAKTDMVSCLIMALIHDLNKVEDLEGRRYYQPNILASGKQSAAKPYEINKALAHLMEKTAEHTPFIKEELYGSLSTLDFISYPDGLVSLWVADKWSPGVIRKLDQGVKQAIIFHDGLYSRASKSLLMGNETPQQICLHAADMLASHTVNDDYRLAANLI